MSYDLMFVMLPCDNICNITTSYDVRLIYKLNSKVTTAYHNDIPSLDIAPALKAFDLHVPNPGDY
jgi:hypothetical protein